jgi:hypothetical protein
MKVTQTKTNQYRERLSNYNHLPTHRENVAINKTINECKTIILQCYGQKLKNTNKRIQTAGCMATGESIPVHEKLLVEEEFREKLLDLFTLPYIQ